MPWPASTRASRAIAIRTVALELLTTAAMRRARAEASRATGRLANGELRNRTRRRGLSLARQRRPNKLAMHGALFVVARIAFVVVHILDQGVVGRRKLGGSRGEIDRLVPVRRPIF